MAIMDICLWPCRGLLALLFTCCTYWIWVYSINTVLFRLIIFLNCALVRAKTGAKAGAKRSPEAGRRSVHDTLLCQGWIFDVPPLSRLNKRLTCRVNQNSPHGLWLKLYTLVNFWSSLCKTLATTTGMTHDEKATAKLHEMHETYHNTTLWSHTETILASRMRRWPKLPKLPKVPAFEGLQKWRRTWGSLGGRRVLSHAVHSGFGGLVVCFLVASWYNIWLRGGHLFVCFFIDACCGVITVVFTVFVRCGCFGGVLF